MQTTVKERGEKFTGEEVRAILAGRKSMFRRVCKDQPHFEPMDGYWYVDGHPRFKEDVPSSMMRRCPYEPGMRLWVRETWAPIPAARPSGYFSNPELINKNAWYRASDHIPTWGGPWKPSIHMPRWASRITLEVTDVRCEWLQSISVYPEDAIAEGVEVVGKDGFGNIYRDYLNRPDMRCTAVGSFKSLWNSINEQRGFGWESNPLVWAVSFKRLENSNAIQS